MKPMVHLEVLCEIFQMYHLVYQFEQREIDRSLVKKLRIRRIRVDFRSQKLFSCSAVEISVTNYKFFLKQLLFCFFICLNT